MSGDLDAGAMVAVASRVLAAAGQGDMIWGHASVRDPAGRGIWIKAPGWGLEEVDESRVQLVSFDGDVLQGEGSAHLECHIHLQLMQKRGDIGCVVHTHSQPAIAFASLRTPLLPISHDATIFGGADVPRHTETGRLIKDAALGASLAATVGQSPGALLPRHGLVTAGTSVAAAVMYAVLLDRACQAQLTAMAAALIVDFSDDDEARAKKAECWPESQLLAGWNYLVRQADATIKSRDTERGGSRCSI